jgi:hypothetical protein
MLEEYIPVFNELARVCPVLHDPSTVELVHTEPRLERYFFGVMCVPN